MGHSWEKEEKYLQFRNGFIWSCLFVLQPSYSSFTSLVSWTVHVHVVYLLAVTLSLLPAADRVKCRDEFSGAVGKVLTAGHRWLMDSQRIWILKYWVPVKTMRNTSDLKTHYIFKAAALVHQLEMKMTTCLLPVDAFEYSGWLIDPFKCPV